jgi:hypothetical protein
MLCISRIEDVAGVLGIDVGTLRIHCAHEIAHAKTVKNEAVATALLNSALTGNVTAQIFWLKTQAGFKETSRLEHTGADGAAITYEERLRQLDARAPGGVLAATQPEAAPAA